MTPQESAREWVKAGHHPKSDEAELLGHRRIHCQECGFKGWSDDCGACPRDWCPSQREEEV